MRAAAMSPPNRPPRPRSSSLTCEGLPASVVSLAAPGAPRPDRPPGKATRRLSRLIRTGHVRQRPGPRCGRGPPGRPLDRGGAVEDSGDVTRNPWWTLPVERPLRTSRRPSLSARRTPCAPRCIAATARPIDGGRSRRSDPQPARMVSVSVPFLRVSSAAPCARRVSSFARRASLRTRSGLRLPTPTSSLAADVITTSDAVNAARSPSSAGLRPLSVRSLPFIGRNELRKSFHG